MSKQLVLVTGATGHIGFRTLVEVLKAGYRARITTRKIAQIERLKAAVSIQPYLDDLEYEEVPDITADGAFDHAVRDVDYILHLASPIPDVSGANEVTNVKEEFLDPAREGTLNMLRSANKSASVKRVVITSSVVILAPKPGSDKITENDLAPLPDLDTIGTNPWVAYRVSKLLAYYAAQEWMTANKPQWDLIHVLPAYTQGRNELVKDSQSLVSGSNATMLDLLDGKQSETPRHVSLVLVDDVARLEVAALDTTKGRNGDRYIASYPQKLIWADVLPAVQRLFPKALENGILSTEGKQEGLPMLFDSSDSTRTFGIEFAGLEAMVNSLVGQYVELKGVA